MMSKQPSKTSFESQLAELESIVEKMEQGDLPLEEALKQFEKGVSLTKNCQSLLENARQRIQVLSQDQQLQDFSVAEDGADYSAE
ncbi:exodeoxyribonuclease VII small subunit [Pleionea litopenaei]|uniref:Exodeoxyribonuclease 7 small subunit n=2 Tax=Pleionea litopenaei TaxID=3070815 RepID=A0AA51X8F2_9GAMM|nr:exodeoxyribonuclease VII small subunit [Pleionea sp. HL-JVS1]WMS89243.1 exodeoxyribonuclease VII small subunit [Pleionea sp. HL-JVS1]